MVFPDTDLFLLYLTSSGRSDPKAIAVILAFGRELKRANMIQSSRYSINAIRNQARNLVKSNVISRQQCIYTLCKYIPAREWIGVERELEEYDFLLRDRIADLIGDEEWRND